MNACKFYSCFFTISLLLYGCSYTFYPADGNLAFPEREAECSLRFLTEFPEDKNSYELIGTCTGRGFKGIFRSEYDNAYRMIEKCACENGANAIVIIHVLSHLQVDEFRRAEQTQLDFTAYIINLKNENEVLRATPSPSYK